jgi:hypothetical protein
MLYNQVQSNRIISILSIFFLSIFIQACDQTSNNAVSSKSKSSVGIEIKRFEQDLFYMDQQQIDTNIVFLKKKYGEFYNIYFLQIMGFGTDKNQGFKYIVSDFINNQDFKTLVKDCDSIYNEERMKKIESDIEMVFENYQKLFPNDTLPQVTTFVSGFSNGIVNTNGYIGIGLDLFLGADYKFYPSLDFPDYLTKRFTPDHLVPTLAKGMVNSKYDMEPKNQALIDQMLYQGKLLYFTKMMLPETPDSLLIGYTTSQIKWAEENEANIFQLLVSEDLFSKDVLKYRKYTDEAPYTVNLTADSAPRIAWFAGWRIIEKYMAENNNISIEELMNEKDSQKILRLSKYKPN